MAEGRKLYLGSVSCTGQKNGLQYSFRSLSRILAEKKSLKAAETAV